MRLHEEVAIITGSTKGLGRAMANKFAAEGAKVLVTGRSADLGRQVADDIVQNGGEAVYFRADMTEEDDVRALIAAAVERFGKLTVLVNNAAPTELLVAGPDAIDGTVAELSTEGWEKIIKGSLTSAFWGCKYAIPELARAGGGSIINISSHISMLGVPGATAYSVAKAGMHALTRAVATDSAIDNIRCNCLLVGPISLTGLDDPRVNEDWAIALRSMQLTRLGVPDDIANLTAFLASKEAEYLTGIVMPAEGGAMAKLAIPTGLQSQLDEKAATRWDEQPS